MAHIVITAVTVIADGYGCRYRPDEVAEVSDELAAAWVAAGHAEYHVPEPADVDQESVDPDGQPDGHQDPEQVPDPGTAVPVAEVVDGEAVAAGPEEADVEPSGEEAEASDDGAQARSVEQPRKATRKANRNAARRPAGGADEKK